MGVSCYGHMIAKKETGSGTVYSASCNADTAVEALSDFARMQENGQKTMTIGMVNGQLPYMYGDAELTATSYDVIIDAPQLYHPLFGTTRPVINVADYMKTCKLQTAGADESEISDIMKALPDEVPANLAPFMERMQLQNPATPEAQQAQRALLLAFKVAGFF